MNLTDMRALVRCDLRDEDDTNYRWSNDEIARHIELAVSEFSIHIPREVTTSVYTTSGSRSLDLPSQTAISVVAVEYPAGNYPKTYVRFLAWNHHIDMFIDEAPSEDEKVNLYLFESHSITSSESTIPTKHESLVAIGASAYAMLQFAAFSVNRINVGGEKTPQEFRNEGERRLARFNSELKRLGRRNKVRTSYLYQPAAEPSSQSTVFRP